MKTEDLQSGSLWMPEGAGGARLIVVEHTGYWALAIRRELPCDKRLIETRSLPDCWRMLAKNPTAFVVAELTRANADALLDRLCWLERDFPLARLAVVADRSLAFCEGIVREAGAIYFATSPRDAKALADVARRHLRAAPRPELSVVDRVWNELPWGRRL
jgi:hypothetical protein